MRHGNTYIDSLAKVIKLGWPNIKGFSARNLRYMKKMHSVDDSYWYGKKRLKMYGKWMCLIAGWLMDIGRIILNKVLNFG